MAIYRYGNLTIPYEMLQALFCKRFSAQQVYSVLNITCYQQEHGAETTDQLEDLLHTTVSDDQAVPWDNSRKLLVVATAIIFLVGITFNLGLLSFLYKQKKLLKPSWCYVFNLAVTDILVLLNMVAFMIVMNLPGTVMTSRLQTFLFPSLDMFVSSASMLSVTVLAFDRVLKLCLSQSAYNTKIAPSVKHVLAAIWVYCTTIFSLSVARVFHNTSHQYNMFVFWLATVVAFIGALVITGISCIVVVSMYIRHQCIASTRNSGNTSTESLITNDNRKMTVHKNRLDFGNFVTGSRVGVKLQPSNQTGMNKSRLAFKSVLLIMACLPFLAGWSFYLCIQTYEVVNNTYLDSVGLNMAMLLVPWIISAVNPLMFVCTQKSLRNEVGRLVCGIVWRRRKLGADSGVGGNKQLTIV